MKASKKKDKEEYIRSNIKLTPLERNAHVYEDNNDNGFDKILNIYEVFLRKISDTEIRNSLVLGNTRRYENPHYLELKVSSELLRSELKRFIFSRRNVWSSN